MRCWLLSVCLLAALTGAEIHELDRPICYVNDAIITKGDVGERMQQRLYLRRVRGNMPDTAEEMRALQESVLAELVDEELLVQHAESLQVSVNRRAIRREVVAEARRRGLGSDMVTIAMLVRQRERQAKIEQVVQFYEGSQPAAGPEKLRATYRERRDEFALPSRLRLRQVLLASTDPAAAEGLRRELLGLVRAVRGHASPLLRATVDAAFVDRVVEAEGMTQLRLLGGLVDRLLADPALAAEAPRLIEEVGALDLALGEVRSREEAASLAGLLRGICLASEDIALRRELFAAFVAIHGSTSDTARSGDLGLMEPAQLSEAQRQAVADLPAGGISEPFWQGQACVLLMVDERHEARVPSLAEVTAELESLLERRMRIRVRDKTLGELRQRAEIRYLDIDSSGEESTSEMPR